MNMILQQVITGKVLCEVLDITYYVCAPSPAYKLQASILYDSTLRECELLGILTPEQMLEIMISNNLWSMDEETELNSTPARLDALKLEMYNRYCNFQSTRVEQVRKTLDAMRQRQGELSRRKHQYDFYTTSGLAEHIRLQFLISKNLVNEEEKKIEDIEERSEFWLSQIMQSYMTNKPDELQLRQLAKYPKWRMIWSSGRQEGRVFGVPSVWLTEEQQAVISWSKLYDNVNEHPESPPDEVIEDDDLLDGWIIAEQNKRTKERKERDKGGRNKRGAQEVFIPAESSEDAKRIEGLNDASEQFVKRQRMAALKKQGQVSEQHMPDSKQQISIQAAQQFRDRLKKKGK